MYITRRAPTLRWPDQTYLLLLYLVPKDAVKAESSGRQDGHNAATTTARGS